MKKLVFLILFIPSTGFTFNPVAFLQGAHALSALVKDVDDLSGLGFELAEILSDLEIDSSSEEDLNAASTKLSLLSSKAKALGYDLSHLQSLDQELKTASSLREKIAITRRAIQTTKRIAEIMRLRPEAGSKVAELQNLKVQTLLLDEVQGIRRDQKLLLLNEKNDFYERSLLLEEARNEFKRRGR